MCKISASVGLTTICLLVAGLSFAIDPATIEDGHVWFLDEVAADNTTPDATKVGLAGIIVGDPQLVTGLSGKALKFDGVDDGVHIPDSDFINITNGPWPNRTVMAVFNCADVSKVDETGTPVKQTVFEEGGRTRGLTIYVFDGEVYVGGWNRAEYDWNPGSWISAPIGSNEWHAAALIIRDGGEAVDPDKFEMWLDGDLVGKESGGHIYNHANDNSIGYTKENNVFHDDDGSGDGWFFEGLVDEVWILNEALSAADLGAILTGVEPMSKLTGSWGAIKAQH
jgi:hypothetical protein